MNKIDKDSNIPLYVQLIDIILDEIENNLEEGAQLDSEREICEKYNISRTTVRQALDELERKNYICKIQGKGNFVSEKRMNQDLVKFYSFTDEMKKIGKIPSSRIINFEIIQVTDKISKKLRITRNDLAYKITRIRLADNIPMMYELTYLPYDRFLGLTKEILAKDSMYDVFKEKYNAKISYAEEVLEPVLVNRLESIYLEIKEGNPGLKISRTTFEDERVIEYTIGIARGDKFQYRVYLKNT